MKFLFLAMMAPLAVAFAPAKHAVRTSLELDMASRREAIASGLAALLVAAPAVAREPTRTQAGIGSDRDFANDYEVVAGQQATGGLLDLNSAFVADYKALPGMYPTAAGKIASNGPYQDVKDIYKIPGLTDNDKKLFKQYEKAFTAKKASARTFNERINARVST